MRIGNYTRLLAVLVFVILAIGVASCGGGSDPTTTNPGEINVGNNNPPAQNFDGPNQYDGKQQPGTADPFDPSQPIQQSLGSNIFAVPTNSTNNAQLLAKSFSPGQKVAFVAVNTNPAYLDAHYNPGTQSSPNLPQSAYSVNADLVSKGTSSVNYTLADLQAETLQSLGDINSYAGMDYSHIQMSPTALYEREAYANGNVPFAADDTIKSTSALQKGEVRYFLAAEPTIPPPTINPGPEDPEKDVQDLQWPPEYLYSQAGRLVSIGSHCYIWLTTEVNNGKPDNVQYTEARLNRMAREFDTVIFPTLTEAFGEVQNYDELNVWKDLDKNAVLTGDDFDTNGELLTELPGEPDTNLRFDQRINIFIHNSFNPGGFYTWGISQETADALREQGRDDLIEQLANVGSTLYITSDNFPNNDDSWDAAFSVMAHEFQHKLYADNGMPTRQRDPEANFSWLNEGMSQLSIHLCGYTVNSGKIVPWAITNQVVPYLQDIQHVPVPTDGNPQVDTISQYGATFMFFLYLYEHYEPGIGKRIYAAGKKGEEDPIALVEVGALQKVVTDLGPDDTLGTADDVVQEVNDTFEQLFTKYSIANFIDGIYTPQTADLFDPRFHYNTIDLKGTINLAGGTVVLPGVKTGVFPSNGTYPINSIHREVRPWCSDYIVFGGGDGRDLQMNFYTDQHMKFFMLPVTFDPAQNAVTITPNVVINN